MITKAGRGSRNGGGGSSRPVMEAATGCLKEYEITARWEMGVAGGLRLVDGRLVRVLFPGTPGRGPGPDFRAALLEIGGDTVAGDVEMHERESGWRAHRHQRDRRYDGVALHVVGRNDAGALATLSRAGRAIPILVVSSGGGGDVFEPPCTKASRESVSRVLRDLGEERLDAKAARLTLLAEARGPAQALYFAMLETLGGPSNRVAFAEIARRLPLEALLERAADLEDMGLRRRLLAAELRWVAAGLSLTAAGQRPWASPGRRLQSAAGLVAVLWPRRSLPAFPRRLAGRSPNIPAVDGLGRSTRRELTVNAVLPVALLAAVPREDVLAAYERAASPGTYGYLRRLESWLAKATGRPFATARSLQGGILLHRRWCSRGMCGRCPLSRDRRRCRQ